MIGARTLTLADLGPNIPALTTEAGGWLTQACLVCFAECGHPAPLEFRVHFDRQDCGLFTITWPGTISPQVRRTWSDLEEATEYAACGLAILLIRSLTPHTVIERSYKGTGFDYWVGDIIDDEIAPFQRRARLEVSGILHGTDSSVRQRVAQKLKQTQASDGIYAAYIIVVEFSRPASWVEHKP